MNQHELDKSHIDEFYGELEQTETFDYSKPLMSEENFDPFDNAIDDIDFSSIQGKDFKKSFSKANRLVGKAVTKKSRKSRVRKPLTKKFFVKHDASIEGGQKKLGKVIVPRDRELIIQGASEMILSEGNNIAKTIGYHNGRKLKGVVITFNNTSAIDFNLQLFNPSMPLEYLYSTSQNLNDKITVGGGEISYSNLLFNILANPLMIYNAKFTFEGSNISEQIAQPLVFINKNSQAYQKIEPVNVSLQVDPYQYLKNIVFFDIKDVLNRPFIPDGMDVIQYKVLAHQTVVMGFFFDQLQIKRIMYEQAGNAKNLL